MVMPMAGDPDTKLELVETRQFEGSDNHLVVYKVVPKNAG